MASFGILADGNPRWRPDSFGYRRWGTEVGIKYPVVKLLDFAARRPELECSPNPFATIVLANLDTLETREDQRERKDRKFRLVKALYERGWYAERVRQLFLLIDWLVDLPEPLAIEFEEELTLYGKEKQMPFISSPERYGLRQGLTQGIEGMLRLKFGEPGLKLMPEIRQIKNHEKLKAILDAVEAAASLEDLRRVWTG